MKYSFAALVLASMVSAKNHHHRKGIKAAVDKKQKEQYEWEWGHNSGNSYNNGPTTHFAHGKGSPYSVTKEDV